MDLTPVPTRRQRWGLALALGCLPCTAGFLLALGPALLTLAPGALVAAGMGGLVFAGMAVLYVRGDRAACPV